MVFRQLNAEWTIQSMNQSRGIRNVFFVYSTLQSLFGRVMKMPGTDCSSEVIAVTKALKNERLSNRGIAEKVIRGRRTVDRIVSKMKNRESLQPKSKSGRRFVL